MLDVERTDLVGTLLDQQWQVGPLLGLGSVGVVFDATCRDSTNTLAIKILRPRMLKSHEAKNSFYKEAEAAKHIRHPGLLRVHHLGHLEDGSPYLVSDRLEGQSLAALLERQGCLPEQEVLALTLRVALILKATHEAGFVHRDIKPEHIWLHRTSKDELTVRLIDFGTCASSQELLWTRLEETGRVYGSPWYASPEQNLGIPCVDGRADLYSLGVTMIEAAWGIRPHPRGAGDPTFDKALRTKVDWSRAELKTQTKFWALARRCLHSRPEGRFSDVRALINALRQLLVSQKKTERELTRRLAGSGLHETCSWITNHGTLLQNPYDLWQNCA